jgi:hypothetical protein
MSGSEENTPRDGTRFPDWQGLNKPQSEPLPAAVQEDGSPFDHSVPYPSAPPVDHGDERQEHYSGARDPEQA